jgi:hypothetical protein
LTQMRRNVMHWLETKAPEVQIQAWHAVAYPQPGRIGSFTPVSMECIKQCWIAPCQGYADTHTGDGQTLVAIANLYNCNVTVHTSTYFQHSAAHQQHAQRTGSSVHSGIEFGHSRTGEGSSGGRRGVV